MEAAEQFFRNAFMVVEVIVIILTFHLIVCLPWFLVVWLAARGTQGLLAPRPRYMLLSGIAAAGMAPVFGHHASIYPMYWELWGVFTWPVSIVKKAALSFAITWGLFLLVGYGVARFQTDSGPNESKKEPKDLA